MSGTKGINIGLWRVSRLRAAKHDRRDDVPPANARLDLTPCGGTICSRAAK